MTLFLIRHGLTQGNLERRYIGVTDEPLCREGRTALSHISPPMVDSLIVSPMRRCRETAAILFPEMPQLVVDGLRETNFGCFEGHTYDELKNNPHYQLWLDSAGQTPPPGGECQNAVRKRVVRAFLDALATLNDKNRAAFVIHGGTIMTLLETFEDKHTFYDWQSPNGGGWICLWDNHRLHMVEKWM